MKNIVQSLIFILLIGLTGHAQELQKDYINYQGVASNASGNAISETAVAIQIALRFGNVTATPSYIENHSVTTDANGVFSLQIGNGTLVSGAYNSADFGTDAGYITVSLNGTEVGTTELVAVPYAISSGDTQWQLNGINIENKNTGTVIISNNFEVTGTATMSTGATIDEFSTDSTLADDSDTALPTEKAVKTYVDNITDNAVTRIDDLSDGKTSTTALYLGEDAGFTDTSTDRWNVGVGFEALYSNTTGDFNTANGYQAMHFNTTGDNNVANGYRALYSNTMGNSNTASGNTALLSNTIGEFNTAIGSSALFSNTTGNLNTAIGVSALFSNITGSSNLALGIEALPFNTAGSFNTALGTRALYSSEGSGNVALGYEAGAIETGNNKLYIDNSSTSSPLIYGEFDNDILVFNGSVTAKSSNDFGADLVLGGSGNTANGDDGIITSNLSYPGSDIFLRSNDNVAIVIDGANDPVQNGDFEIYNGASQLLFRLNEDGNAVLSGSLTQNSDRRLKKDIEDLPYGLHEILQLQPKSYSWKNRIQQNKSLGLIAQDVQKLIKEVVTAQDDEKRTLGISYTELIPVLINAIKEQQTQIEVLKTKTKSQDMAMVEVLQRLKNLESHTVNTPTKTLEVASKE